MKNDRERVPTPQELSKVVGSMTQAQKLQFDAIINMITALLVSIYQAQTTDFHEKEN